MQTTITFDSEKDLADFCGKYSSRENEKTLSSMKNLIDAYRQDLKEAYKVQRVLRRRSDDFIVRLDNLKISIKEKDRVISNLQKTKIAKRLERLEKENGRLRVDHHVFQNMKLELKKARDDYSAVCSFKPSQIHFELMKALASKVGYTYLDHLSFVENVNRILKIH